jgi:recombination protein RecA
MQWEVILGGLMGDGALSPSRSGHAARFRVGHGAKQAEYADWKASLFSNIGTSRSTNAKGAVFHDLAPLVELAELRRAVYLPGGKVLSEDFLKRLTPLALAIWYQDDFTFSERSDRKQRRTAQGSGRVEVCVEALSPGSRERLVEYLADTWGVEGSLHYPGARAKARIVFDVENTARLQELVAPYVHPSMQYKLLDRFWGRFAVEPSFIEADRTLMPFPITQIEAKPPNGRHTHRFDIEVDGNHNYFVDGVMVHNSPETTPGGRALKFYSSVRLDIRRIESIKDGGENTGNRVRVKVAKNKMAPPFRLAEFDIMFGEGISREGSLLDVAVDQGVVRKSGAWFTFDTDQLGQGRENAKRFLRENPEIAMQLQAKIYELVGLTEAPEAEESAEEADSAK